MNINSARGTAAMAGKPLQHELAAGAIALTHNVLWLAAGLLLFRNLDIFESVDTSRQQLEAPSREDYSARGSHRGCENVLALELLDLLLALMERTDCWNWGVDAGAEQVIPDFGRPCASPRRTKVWESGRGRSSGRSDPRLGTSPWRNSLVAAAYV